MATAIAVVTEQKEEGRGTYLRGAREAWFDWKAAGKEPMRKRALEILAEELGQNRANTLGEDMVKNNADGTLNSRLSFLIWDLTENGRGAIDYDEDANFVRALLQQAADIISGTWVYASRVTKGGIKFLPIPETVKVSGSGVQSITRASRETREQWAENLIYSAKYLIARARGVKGVNWPFIRQTLARLIKEARAEWAAKNGGRASEAAD